MKNCDKRESRTSSRRSVLVVDDDEVTQLVFSRILSRFGWVVTLAGTVGEALQQLRQRIYDLVILDTYLPDMHGSEVAKAIRSDPKSATYTKIAAVSSDDGAANIQLMKQAGADQFLVKPVSAGTLEELVGNIPPQPVRIDTKSRLARVKHWSSKRA
jgi:two-component system sensor histidine kinase/response regulator